MIKAAARHLLRLRRVLNAQTSGAKVIEIRGYRLSFLSAAIQ
jgi:hypothetical protein